MGLLPFQPMTYITFCVGGWMRRWRRLALVSPNGVAPSWMVGVSASVNLPLHHKVQILFWHRLTRVSPGERAVKRLQWWWCA